MLILNFLGGEKVKYTLFLFLFLFYPFFSQSSRSEARRVSKGTNKQPFKLYYIV